ncbi:MAG TPA: 7TM diverse intracellular signaling domain-containing protein [Leptospiraceae bacterium]|nr:7TM diverse intracellular signaling domain-containing protein [Leptospiraceae bacterium]HMY66023.1 7TM diverse intracellular signaling domain-containing protein [Leptospiraceae bacterium]HNF14412.1 7TM diverse intracellular signaling domain-containing protein [Leptospiraceae bacterium]HNF27670.1 7TM diverse intracellular signaling domain-containing protein [Leptospiraceae bacterium]HNH08326.1 7TM diverse intracellular signaling domain-containing protein [Leptospiraceae bacterium]
MKYMEDPEGKMSFQDVLQSELEKKFRSVESDTPTFGYARSAYWFILPYRSETDLSDFLGAVEFPILDEVNIFYYNKENRLTEKIFGRKLKFREREIYHRDFLFRMSDFRNSGKIYLRVKTESSLQVPLILYKENRFWETDQTRLAFQFLFIGIMTSMILYNLLLGLSLKDRIYFYYILYVISASLFLAGLNGINYQIFWPDLPGWNKISSPVLLSLTNLGIAVFADSFLKVKDHYIILHRIFMILKAASLTGFFCSFVFSYITVSRLLLSNVLSVSILSIITSALIAFKGYRPAFIYMISWAVLLFGAFLLALSRFGFIPLNFLTENTAQIGVALEAILISFALADRIKILQKEKESAQFSALEAHGKAEMLKHDMELAAKIQKSILPNKIPRIEGLEISAWYHPMESVGGDFYDFRENDGNLGFIMADVSGHGVPAALVVSSLKTAFWFQDLNHSNPSELLHSLNQILDGKTGGEFITACYVHLDMKNRILKTGNAGHSALVVFQRETEMIKCFNPKGAALCIRPNPKFDSLEFPLSSGDRIILYTDGLFEVENFLTEQFSQERIFAILKENSHLSGNEFGEHLLSRVKEWSGGKEKFEDDIALIVVDVK